jgi:hypothetical protein
VEPLKAALKDGNDMVREAAQKALDRIGQRATAQQLAEPQPRRSQREVEPIEIPSKWTPGKTLKLMSYNEAIAAITSGNPERVSEAVGSNILNAATIYNDISQSLDPSSNERLVDLLVPLLKHDDYQVRNITPAVLELIGDDTTIPYLEEVIADDPDSQVIKNARLAVEKIRSRHARTDAVKFIRRYTKPIDASTQGTYEEFNAPSRVVARAYLDKTRVTRDHFYIEVVTPEGNVGKDKNGLY